MQRPSGDTAPPGWQDSEGPPERARESPAEICSSSLDTQQPGPTWPRRQRQFSPTSAGGVVAANGSRATICSSSAGPGRSKSESYGGTSGRPASGNCPRAPAVRPLFQDERATPAVLQFLWDTKVGRMITLPPPERRRTSGGGLELWESCCGEGGPGTP